MEPDTDKSTDARKPQPSTRRQLSTTRKICFSLIAVCLSLAILEGIARVIEKFVPAVPTDYDAGFTPRAKLYERHSENLFALRFERSGAFNRQTFKAVKPADKLRIAAIGGSSVHQLNGRFQTMARDYLEKIGSKYWEIELLNGGGAAHGTHRLITILREILTHDVDAVYIYSGHNEFLELKQFRVYQGDFYAMERAGSRLALVRLMRDSVARFRLARQRRELNKIVEEPTPALFNEDAKIELSQEEVDERIRNYASNLRLLVKMCQEKDVPVVIATVVANHRYPKLTPSARERFKEAEALYQKGEHAAGLELSKKILRESRWRNQATEHENSIIRELARETGIMFVDVEKIVRDQEPNGVLGETLFNDHCHLKPAGDKLMLDAVIPKLIAAATEKRKQR